MRQSTKDFLWFAVAPPASILLAGYLLGKTRRVGIGVPAGWSTVMCSPYNGHSVCVIKSKYDDKKFSFTVDNGPSMPDGDEWWSPEAARDAAERFIDDMT